MWLMVLKMCKENSHVCYTLLISRKGEYLYAKRNKSKAKIIPSRTDHAGKYRWRTLYYHAGNHGRTGKIRSDRRSQNNLCRFAWSVCTRDRGRGRTHRQPLSLPRSQPPIRTAGIKASGRFHPVFQIHYREEDQHTDKEAGKAGQQIRCTEAAATGVCIRKN